MPLRNRVDPFGDLHVTSSRGMFTGNRGCLVDRHGSIVRHHVGSLWITCVTSYRGWHNPLAEPGHWTPLFFLDDAVALAAGHRPCGLCRRTDYLSYQLAVTESLGRDVLVSANEQNRILADERLRRGRGLSRANDRRLWTEESARIPPGTIIVENESPLLVMDDRLMEFDFAGWRRPRPRPASGTTTVLTPPTSVEALRHGFVPKLHQSIAMPV